MNDEFLHRLRRDPPPEFAARLQARLWQQPALARPRGPSLLRNLVTVLLLGGTAFAVTSFVISGLPASLMEWSQHAASRIAAQHASAPAFRPHSYGSRAMRPWSPPGSSSPGSNAPPGRPPHSAAPATNPPAADTTGTASNAAPGVSPNAASRTAAAAAAPQNRQITVVASWAAYPYIAPLADDFNHRGLASGTPGGLSVGISVRDSSQWPGSMCDGGANAPDMAYSFEPVGTVPHQPCPPPRAGSPRSIIAIPAGFEAVALARSPIYGAPDFTRREIFLALAKWVPDSRGQAVHENPNTTWRQIDSALGPEPIEFLGPPLSSPAGHSMIELLLEGGCQTIPWIAALETADPARYDRICRTVRTDGIYVEVPWLAPSKLVSDPNAVGIFGLWSLKYIRMTDLSISRLDGVEPTAQAIESGAYLGSRGFFLYVNRTRTPPNLVFRFLMDDGWPRSAEAAFIPLSQSDLKAAMAEIRGP